MIDGKDFAFIPHFERYMALIDTYGKDVQEHMTTSNRPHAICQSYYPAFRQFPVDMQRNFWTPTGKYHRNDSAADMIGSMAQFMINTGIAAGCIQKQCQLPCNTNRSVMGVAVERTNLCLCTPKYVEDLRFAGKYVLQGHPSVGVKRNRIAVRKKK